MSLKGKKQAFNILRGEGDEASLESYDVELISISIMGNENAHGDEP